MPYKDPEARLRYMKEYREKYRERLLMQKRIYFKKQGKEVLLHYSNGGLQCACCGESTYEFLSLDHIKGNGNKHRKSLGSNYIMSYLKQNDFPLGYQVLCHNCNMAKGFYGECPHERINTKVTKAKK